MITLSLGILTFFITNLGDKLSWLSKSTVNVLVFDIFGYIITVATDGL